LGDPDLAKNSYQKTPAKGADFLKGVGQWRIFCKWLIFGIIRSFLIELLMWDFVQTRKWRK
jgi:hypothetical protein